MPYYEIIYETGSHAIAQYMDDDEAMIALNAHQDRAKSGEPATPSSEARSDVTDVVGPTSWAAERIERILVFDNHPADYGVGEQVKAEELTAAIEGMSDSDGLVSVPEAAATVRAASSPFVAVEGPHDSIYAMQPSHELDWSND